MMANSTKRETSGCDQYETERPSETKVNDVEIATHKQEHSELPERWFQRQDLLVLILGLVFIAALLGAMFGFGALRQWNAPSGYSHNFSTTSKVRFIEEPYVEDLTIRGRSGADRQGRWYYWKLPPNEITIWTRVFVWLGYSGHQLTIWFLLWQAQVSKAKSTGPRYSTKLDRYSWASFGVNIFFHILHLVQTHVTYDALAQDVSITSSQGSVIMLIIVIIVMEYSERGIFFGWPVATSTSKISRKIRLNLGAVHLLRRYHGYAFAWAAIYTFWYHPMENTYGHALGFFHTWILVLQGSLMYTKFHLNRWWRLILETWVIVHAGFVAVQTGGPALKGTQLWPMFVFGFSLTLCLTQIFILPFWTHIPKLTRIIPLIVWLAVALGNYSWIPDANGRTWVRMPGEVIRIPGILYGLFLFTWAITYLFLWIDKKIQEKRGTTENEMSPTLKILCVGLCLLIYIIFVIASSLVEVMDWKIMMFVLLTILMMIYLIGVALTTVILRNAVPTRVSKTVGGSVDKVNPCEEINNSHSLQTLDSNAKSIRTATNEKKEVA